MTTNVRSVPLEVANGPTPTSESALINHPSAAAWRQISNLRYVILPLGWSRLVSPTSVVTYVSPSGRVLLSPAEASTYLSTDRYCKCHLDGRLAFAEVFNFDPTVASLALLTSNCTSKCSSWASLMPADDMRQRLATIRRYLAAEEVATLDAAKAVRARTSSTIIEATVAAAEDSLAALDLKEHQVLRTGEIFYRRLTNGHLAHLAYEFAQSATDVSLPEEQKSESDLGTLRRISDFPGHLAEQMKLLLLKELPDQEETTFRGVQLNTDGTVSVFEQVAIYGAESEHMEEDEDEELDDEQTEIDEYSSDDKSSTTEVTEASAPESDEWEAPESDVSPPPSASSVASIDGGGSSLSSLSSGRPRRACTAEARAKIRQQLKPPPLFAPFWPEVTLVQAKSAKKVQVLEKLAKTTKVTSVPEVRPPEARSSLKVAPSKLDTVTEKIGTPAGEVATKRFTRSMARQRAF